MATVINNPSGSENNSSAGVIIGVIVAILLIAAFLLFVLPAIRNRGATPAPQDSTNINVSVPGDNGGANGGAGGNPVPNTGQE
jgi:hypothetical protein